MVDVTEYRDQQGRVISIRIPEDLARGVESAAANELISVSAFARRALLRAVRSLDEARA